jgi:hypothetical protein
MKTTYLLLKIEHTKDIQDLTDIAAGRVYTLDKVEDVTASLLTQEQVSCLERPQQLGKPPSKLLDFLLKCLCWRA